MDVAPHSAGGGARRRGGRRRGRRRRRGWWRGRGREPREVAGLVIEALVALQAFRGARRGADEVSELPHTARDAPDQHVGHLRPGGRSVGRGHVQVSYDVDAQTCCTVGLHRVIHVVARKSLASKGKVVVGELGLVEEGGPSRARPPDEVFHHVLNLEPIDGDICPMNHKPVPAVGRVRLPAAIVVVGVPKPGVVDDDPRAINLDMHIGSSKRTASVLEGAHPGKDIAQNAAVAGPLHQGRSGHRGGGEASLHQNRGHARVGSGDDQC
mmetsp:Transcript_82099/g.171869  ORF Transcript_82099/g.171869 Transcript_82099/m.171869 type:complete len:268 (-) Transcript_82099:859-1662(-)